MNLQKTGVVESVLQVAACRGVLAWCVRVNGAGCVRGLREQGLQCVSGIRFVSQS